MSQKPLDTLPGSALLDYIRDALARESSRIYEDQAYYVECGLHDSPAACQIEKADLFAAAAAVILTIRDEGNAVTLKLNTAKEKGEKPNFVDASLSKLIGRALNNARVEIIIQRQKRENTNDEPADTNSDAA